MAKRALLVGINYPGTEYELSGCVNDAMLLRALLIERYAFLESNITMLLDGDATKANALAATRDLFSAAGADDRLFWGWSSHGTHVRDMNQDELDGLDEAIVPFDGLTSDRLLIRDDELGALVRESLHPGARLTMSIDACHSGSMLRDFPHFVLGAENVTKYRVLPAQRWGTDSPAVHGLRGLLRMLPKLRRFGTRLLPDPHNVVLISATTPRQLAADAYIAGRYNGAHTYALDHVLRSPSGQHSVKHVVHKMREWLVNNGYGGPRGQSPQISGDRDLWPRVFLA